MADLLPSSPDLSEHDGGEPRVVGVDSDDADEMLSALSSETARSILTTLHEEPASASEVADRMEMTLQNVQYHLGNLEDADLVTVADTAYSEKGREMKVYAAADQPLVLFAGREEETLGLKRALSRLLGAVGVLAALSVVVEALSGDPLSFVVGEAGSGGGDAAVSAQATAETAGAAAGGLPPGLVFFLGGLAAVAMVGAYWYLRRR
ncbi:MAG: ArsR/SmtB family transcription factor [Halolamina sp.]